MPPRKDSNSFFSLSPIDLTFELWKSKWQSSYTNKIGYRFPSFKWKSEWNAIAHASWAKFHVLKIILIDIVNITFPHFVPFYQSGTLNCSKAVVVHSLFFKEEMWRKERKTHKITNEVAFIQLSLPPLFWMCAHRSINIHLSKNSAWIVNIRIEKGNVNIWHEFFFYSLELRNE